MFIGLTHQVAHIVPGPSSKTERNLMEVPANRLFGWHPLSVTRGLNNTSCYVINGPSDTTGHSKQCADGSLARWQCNTESQPEHLTGLLDSSSSNVLTYIQPDDNAGSTHWHLSTPTLRFTYHSCVESPSTRHTRDKPT